MDTEEKVILMHISSTLDKIFDFLSKPQNMVARIFEIGAAIVTILGILTIIDLIKSWIGG
jgi:energy-converting hydrogenase Eha subunit F